MKKTEIAAARRKELLDLVKVKGRQLGELSKLMGIPRKVLTNDVVRMADHAELHYVIESFPMRSGGTSGRRVYYPGPGPVADQAHDPQPAYRPVATSWKPNNRRDPLVAALFGAPNNDPRCACCREPQGEPHITGCRYEGLAA